MDVFKCIKTIMFENDLICKKNLIIEGKLLNEYIIDIINKIIDKKLELLSLSPTIHIKNNNNNIKDVLLNDISAKINNFSLNLNSCMPIVNNVTTELQQTKENIDKFYSEFKNFKNEMSKFVETTNLKQTQLIEKHMTLEHDISQQSLRLDDRYFSNNLQNQILCDNTPLSPTGKSIINNELKMLKEQINNLQKNNDIAHSIDILKKDIENIKIFTDEHKKSSYDSKIEILENQLNQINHIIGNITKTFNNMTIDKEHVQNMGKIINGIKTKLDIISKQVDIITISMEEPFVTNNGGKIWNKDGVLNLRYKHPNGEIKDYPLNLNISKT